MGFCLLIKLNLHINCFLKFWKTFFFFTMQHYFETNFDRHVQLHIHIGQSNKQNKKKKTYLVEKPAAAGITGAAVGDVGEPDGFFWSSSEDSKDVCPVCLRGRPSDNLLEVALLLTKIILHVSSATHHTIDQSIRYRFLFEQFLLLQDNITFWNLLCSKPAYWCKHALNTHYSLRCASNASVYIYRLNYAHKCFKLLRAQQRDYNI